MIFLVVNCWTGTEIGIGTGTDTRATPDRHSYLYINVYNVLYVTSKKPGWPTMNVILFSPLGISTTDLAYVCLILNQWMYYVVPNTAPIYGVLITTFNLAYRLFFYLHSFYLALATLIAFQYFYFAYYYSL